MKTFSVFLCFLSLSFSFLIYGQRSQSKAYVADLKEITDIMMYDVTSPVAAARYYAYSTLASYELLAYRDKQHSSFFDFFQRTHTKFFPRANGFEKSSYGLSLCPTFQCIQASPLW